MVNISSHLLSPDLTRIMVVKYLDIKYVCIYCIFVFNKYSSICIVPPKIAEDGNVKDYVAVLGKPLRVECEASGTPLPSITWLKNGLPFTDKDNVLFKNDGFTLFFMYILEEDSADYTCIATNDAGSVEQKFNLTVLGNCFTLHICFLVHFYPMVHSIFIFSFKALLILFCFINTKFLKIIK